MNECEGGGSLGDGDDEDQVQEWEAGLPTADDLTPLSQSLISPGLAVAFSITPEPSRSMLDVNRASQDTLSSLCHQPHQPFSSNHNLRSIPSFAADDDPEADGNEPESNTQDGFDPRKSRRVDAGEESESALPNDNCNNNNEDQSAQTLKRPRLVWTPQLHKRFIDVVAHLGIKNAVPKTIMQLMNVEGLTRENVASHLQKYRLYLKRMQGLSNEGPSSSDHLFASTPAPVLQGIPESGNHSQYMPPRMPSYSVPLLPMPVGHRYGHGRHPHLHMGIPVANRAGLPPPPPSYNMNREQPQQQDWSGI